LVGLIIWLINLGAIMTNENKFTAKEKILKAALDVFIAKGKDGARMHEIADRAGVNKAMLFYYYTSKDLLYAEVLRTNILEIITSIKNIFISEDDSKKKVEQIVNAYIDFFDNHPHLPKLILREIASNGSDLAQVIGELKQQLEGDIPHKFVSLIQNNLSDNYAQTIDAKQTIISIIGMSIIYFIGKPIIDILLEIENVDHDEFIQQRKKNIMFILRHGLFMKESQ
jgi:AcrR family transcriptional regulator